ncbi:MAG: hypothetical protein EXS31_05570 [Pedosphaera sp.]|nr:hypothetical protein [Pedosphaera sp.]
MGILMATNEKCSACGAELTGTANDGLCGQCLLNLALAPTEAGATNLSVPHLSSDAADGVRTFGDYELIEELARGGMGVVYRARQGSLNRVVAVKMILAGQFASKQIAQRFKSEAIAAAVLHHPNIVAIHEVGVHEGQHFFSMDYIEGQNLSQLVGNRPLPAHQAATYLKLIAEAIHYAHEQGILHRDLKPSNILVEAATNQPRVTDFGLAKRLDGESSITVTGQVLGSPNFMPPEQASGARGKVGRHSDVYGLGGILYYLLTARAPFQGETLETTINQVLNNEPLSPRTLNPSVPQDLETICLKCLEKEPTKRYPTARELGEELGRFLKDEPIHARPIKRVERVWRWCRRKPALAGSLMAAAIFFAIGFMGILSQWRRAERNATYANAQSVHARRSLYAADMALAFHALEGANLGRARELLERYEPRFGVSAIAGREPANGKNGHSPFDTGRLEAELPTDLRGWEWRYLSDQTRDQAVEILGSNLECVYRLSLSPDGRFLASGSADNQVRIWDWPNRRALTNIPSLTSRAVFKNFSNCDVFIEYVASNSVI